EALRAADVRAATRQGRGGIGDDAVVAKNESVEVRLGRDAAAADAAAFGDVTARRYEVRSSAGSGAGPPAGGGARAAAPGGGERLRLGGLGGGLERPAVLAGDAVAQRLLDAGHVVGELLRRRAADKVRAGALERLVAVEAAVARAGQRRVRAATAVGEDRRTA